MGLSATEEGGAPRDSDAFFEHTWNTHLPFSPAAGNSLFFKKNQGQVT